MATERTVTIPAAAERVVAQSLLRISINIGVNVEVVLNTDGKVSTRTFSGSQYDDLMSASPPWAVGKPAGVFRPEDIFTFMDYLETP
jgi:hypothetical protein